jgi:hypothetical protein
MSDAGPEFGPDEDENKGAQKLCNKLSGGGKR